MMKFRRLRVATHVRVDLDGVAVRLPQASDLAKRIHQSSAGMSSMTLPEEIIEEILLRVPPEEPAHLVCATVVCKAWHSILSDDTFRRRYGRFHGTPPLQGYICSNFRDSTVPFVTTTSVAAASPLCTFKLDDSSGRKPSARDCRHGRVLIETDCSGSRRNRRLVVWDTISGSLRHLNLPTHPRYPYRYNYAGAVLCSIEGCDHFDCHGGPFIVVLVGMSYDNDDEQDGQTWASIYSSETGVWSSPTTPNDTTNKYIDDFKPIVLIGHALYFISDGYSIIKYDLCKHGLSVIYLPVALPSILIKGNDGGLVVASMLGTCIYMWSLRVDNRGDGGWVKCREIELNDTLLPKGGYLPDLICMAEGTNIVFIGVQDIGVFTLDLRSRQVKKIGEKETYYYRPILPYISISTPKY